MNWKYIFPGIAMVGVTYALARFSFGMFLPAISNELNLSAGTAGAISSAAFVAYCTALLTLAQLLRFFHPLRVVQFAGFSAGAGLIGIAAAPSAEILAVSSFIAALGSGWASPAYSQLTAIKLDANNRDQANTWINTGTGAGLIVTGMIALGLMEQWRIAYLIFAIAAFGVGIWNTIALSSTLQRQSEYRSKANLFASLLQAKPLVIASLLAGFASAIFWTFSRSYLNEVHGMTTQESVLFWALMGAAGIIGGMAGGLVKKIGLRSAYRFTLFFLLGSNILLTVPFLFGIYFSGILFGISYILMTGLLIVWGTLLFRDSPATGVSVAFLALGIGQSIGAFIGGRLIELTSYPIGFYCITFLSLTAFFVPVITRQNGRA